MTRPGTLRLIGFGAGDFAFNLYWQSTTLVLLFFTTDVLGLPPATAGLVYTIGAIWDGIADVIVGIAAEKGRARYRRWVVWGALPLGLTFALLYVPGAPLAAVIAGQLAFRTLYAAVNVPYTAWSARISDDSRDRALLSGARMLFGTAAAVVVALATPGIAAASGAGAGGYLVAAIVFAAAATPLLIAVAARAPEAVPPPDAPQLPLRTHARALTRNRAFAMLNLAAAGSAVAAAISGQSVLFYFKHVAGDTAAGAQALALMNVAGAAATPLWTLAAAKAGARAAWLIATAAALLAIAVFALLGGVATLPATIFLIALQASFAGLFVGFWAMLPDTVEYGELTTGVRVEALAFGVAALIQKLALALAAAIVGGWYDMIGYAPTAAGEGVAGGIRALLIAGPALALVVSGAAMLAQPLRRHTHAGVVAALKEQAAP